MKANILALAVLLLGSAPASDAAAQDIASTTAAMGAAATVGSGIGSSARGAVEGARNVAYPTRARGINVEEADGPGQGGAGGGGGGGGGEGAEKAKGPAGFYVSDDDDSDDDEAGPIGPAPEEYTVHKGDTLWDLCSRFLGDSWSWPKVWSRNPNITNPHWIFPGDRIRFGTGGPRAAAVPAAVKGKGPRITITRAGGALGQAMVLRSTAFVGADEMKGAATIVGSREEKEMLSTHDQAYVEFPADAPLKVGERYTIYRPEAAIKHPTEGGTVGHMVKILGEVQVEQITQGRIARGPIVDAMDPIERGARVGPLARQFRPVERTNNRQQLDGVVLSMIRIGELIGSTELVFIDRGRKHGVEQGNLFYVIRRGDGYRPMAEQVVTENTRFPKEVVAELIVVDVRVDTSLAYVARSSKELRKGDRLEMRKGY